MHSLDIGGLRIWQTNLEIILRSVQYTEISKTCGRSTQIFMRSTDIPSKYWDNLEFVRHWTCSANLDICVIYRSNVEIILRFVWYECEYQVNPEICPTYEYNNHILIKSWDLCGICTYQADPEICAIYGYIRK